MPLGPFNKGSENARFRVVAIRRDGAPVILCRKLSRDDAEAVVDALGDARAFRSISAEPDDNNPLEMMAAHANAVWSPTRADSDDSLQDANGTYRITSLEPNAGAVVLARGLTAEEATRLRSGLAINWPEMAFTLEAESALEPGDDHLCQVVGMGVNRHRKVLMTGMTSDQAQMARDAVLTIGNYGWAWVERQPA